MTFSCLTKNQAMAVFHLVRLQTAPPLKVSMVSKESSTTSGFWPSLGLDGCLDEEEESFGLFMIKAPLNNFRAKLPYHIRGLRM